MLQLSQAELAHPALTLAPLREEKTVFVSSAAGSIGTMAWQLARLASGSGSAGGSERADRAADGLPRPARHPPARSEPRFERAGVVSGCHEPGG
jgi:NADPH:quinone reductase-like Zn-dependent oxidoreductase